MPTTHYSQKVLIVEDEMPMLMSLKDNLSAAGFGHLLEAKDGEEGLAVALREKPDLILLDILMPKMDGVTMMGHLRESCEYGKKVPIIFLTNLNADDKIMDHVIKDEPAFYLVKANWTVADVVQKVKERLNF